MVQSVIRTVDQDADQLRAALGIAPGDRDGALARALQRVLEAEVPGDRRPRGTEVGIILHELGVDETTLVAALLSDPRLQDELPRAALAEAFGEDVAELVESVRWLNTFKDCEQTKTQDPEQIERLRRMLLALIGDIRALLIRLAYRLQRLRGLSAEPASMRHCIARETLDLYAPLANRLGIARLKWELEDLAFRELEPQAYRRVARALEESRREREAYIAHFVETLREALEKEGIRCEVKGRPKHIYSIWKKMQRKDLNVDELHDLRAVRVIVERVADCYAALGVVHGLWRHIPKEFDDYIANPKENGYRSLHTAVIGPQGKVVEVQIRTREMHEYAERGVAAHWLYKEGGKQDALMQRSIQALQQLLEAGKDDPQLMQQFRTELFQDRVFVLTPSGEVVDLPKGATPLDFAYAIHTEVGHRCRGAKVNGRIVPLNHTLRSGEQVEILTAREPRPSRDWLSPHLGYLRTAKAKARVRQWFRQQDRERNVKEGKQMVERELQRLGVEAVDLDEIARRFNRSGAEDLYAAIGRGDMSLHQLAGALRVPGLEPERLRAGAAQSGEADRRPGGVTIRGVGNLLTQRAGCCKPMPGDVIRGYITQGRGVSVHRADCPELAARAAADPGRLVDVEWGGDAEVYPVDIRILGLDRKGLLRDVTGLLADEKVNVVRADTRTDSRDHSVRMELRVEVRDSAQLSRILDKLWQIPSVLEARRAGA
jgi:GTP pyrophosphokinase